MAPKIFTAGLLAFAGSAGVVHAAEVQQKQDFWQETEKQTAASACKPGSKMGDNTVGLLTLDVNQMANGDTCVLSKYASLHITDMPEAKPVTYYTAEEAGACWQTLIDRILEDVTAVDGDDIDYLINFYGFSEIESIKPAIEKMKTYDLAAKLGESKDCLVNNEMASKMACELVNNPTQFGVSEDLGRSAYESKINYNADGQPDPNGTKINDLPRLLRRFTSYWVILDVITQTIADSNDGTKEMTDLHDAANARYPKNWEIKYMRENFANIFGVAKKHSVDPAIDGMKVTDMKGEAPVMNCCTDDNMAPLIQANILEAVMSDYAYNLNDNAAAGMHMVNILGYDARVTDKWMRLYEAWNMAFVSGFNDMVPLLISKLIIPSVSCTANSRHYLGYRGIALFLTVYFGVINDMLNDDYAAPIVPNHFRNRLVAERFGVINREWSDAYAAEVMEAASGSPKDNLEMKRVEAMFWDWWNEELRRVKMTGQVLPGSTAETLRMRIFTNYALTFEFELKEREVCLDLIMGVEVCAALPRQPAGRRRLAAVGENQTVMLSLRGGGLSGTEVSSDFKVAQEPKTTTTTTTTTTTQEAAEEEEGSSFFDSFFGGDDDAATDTKSDKKDTPSPSPSQAGNADGANKSFAVGAPSRKLAGVISSAFTGILGLWLAF